MRIKAFSCDFSASLSRSTAKKFHDSALAANSALERDPHPRAVDLDQRAVRVAGHGCPVRAVAVVMEW